MKISQREARRLRKRVAELERIERERNHRWAADYPGGVNFWTMPIDAEPMAAIRTARSLGHYVVVSHYESTLRFHAIPMVPR